VRTEIVPRILFSAFLMHQPEGENQRPAGVMTTVIATLAGNLMLVAATVVLGGLGTVFGWIPPRGHVVYALGRLWSRLILAAGFIRLHARFEQPLEPQRGYIFMANHQSMYDIPALMATTPGQGRFMAKASLFKIPIFGWSLKSGGFIAVDRRDRAGGEKTFKAALRSLERGHSLIIFPEEKRSDGTLLPFKRGGFLLALKTGFPIVPVGIHGTREIRRRASHIIHPGRIEVHYGAPVDAASFGLGGRRALVESVRQRVGELAGRAPARRETAALVESLPESPRAPCASGSRRGREVMGAG